MVNFTANGHERSWDSPENACRFVSRNAAIRRQPRASVALGMSVARIPEAPKGRTRNMRGGLPQPYEPAD